jgi:hypothetical protein
MVMVCWAVVGRGERLTLKRAVQKRVVGRFIFLGVFEVTENYVIRGCMASVETPGYEKHRYYRCFVPGRGRSH